MAESAVQAQAQRTRRPSLYSVGQDQMEGNPDLPRSSSARTPRGALPQGYGLRSSQPYKIGVGVVLLGGRRKSNDDFKPRRVAMLAAC